MSFERRGLGPAPPTRSLPCSVLTSRPATGRPPLPAYRMENFDDHPLDRPLVAQFCGDDPVTLLAACRHVQDKCDAVDLNCGCPQGIARKGHYGAYLLDEPDLVVEIVR